MTDLLGRVIGWVIYSPTPAAHVTRSVTCALGGAGAVIGGVILLDHLADSFVSGR